MAKPVAFLMMTLWVFLSIALVQTDPSHAAAIEEIEASGRYLMGDRDSKLDGRRLALQEAKRNALEQAGTYIESFTEVKNAQLSQDLIRSYTAGIVEVREMDEKAEMVGQSLAITIRVKARIDRDVVVRQIEALRKDRETQRVLEAARKKMQQYERQIAELNQELRTAKGPIRPRIAEVQESRRQALTQVDVQTLLVKARVAMFGTETQRSVGIGTIAKEKVTHARTYVEQALKIDPKSREALAAMGEVLLDENNPHKAESFFRDALRLNPDDTNFHAGLGVALFQQKKLEAAYQAVQQALRLQPESARAHSILGSIYEERGEMAAAIREFREAIRLDPKSAIFHANLAAALSMQGDLAEVIQAAREAIRLNPNLGTAHGILGYALMQQGDQVGARQELQKGCQLEFAKSCVNLSIILAEQGDLTGSIRAAREAIRLDPNLGIAHALLGSNLLRQDQRWPRWSGQASTEARQELETACRLKVAQACQLVKAMDAPLASLLRGCATKSAAVDSKQYAAVDADVGLLLFMVCRLLLARWKRRRRT